MSLPKRIPRHKDQIRTHMLIGRIRLSYDPPRELNGVDLDDANIDVLMRLKKWRIAECRLAMTYNTLEDWRVIDEEVKNSHMIETHQLIEKIKRRIYGQDA